MLYGDANAFLGKSRGGPIEISPDTILDFCIVTAAPPFTLEGDVLRPLTTDETIAKVSDFKKMIVAHPRLQLVLNKDELQKAISSKRIGVILGLQNTPTDSNPRFLFEAGIRIMSLAYYGENDNGSGFKNWGIGLKIKGKGVVKTCADAGIIIDLSHVGYQTALDALVFIKEKGLNCRVMASHSGCVAVYPHMRNITNDLMKMIVGLGGVVGITTITFNLDQWDNGCEPFIKHLGHIVNMCGKENVVIGSDAIYGDRSHIEGQKDMEKIAPRADPIGIQGIRWPETIFEGPRLMENIDMSLSSHAVAPDFISKVMGMNLVNFLERALPAE